MPVHREDGNFQVRIELVAEFDEDYEGDDDGYAWLERWKAETRPRLLKAVFDALRADATCDVIPVSRGASPDEEAEILMRLRPR
ncbi:MAG TPA: hypothetical protein VF316_23400 [Polyangiaceae bacterium]